MSPQPRKNAKDRHKASKSKALPIVSLDDASTILLQLEPNDTAGFQRLKDVLESLACGGNTLPEVASLMREAVSEVDCLLQGGAKDGEDVLIEISRTLEAATSLMDTPTGEGMRGNCVQNGGVVDSAPRAKVSPPASTSDATECKAQQSVSSETPNNVHPSAPEGDSLDQLPPDADRDLLSEFISESLELLEGAESAMLTLEGEPSNADAVNQVFRAFHTIKGTSGFLGLERHSGLAHHAESLLSRIRNGEIRFAGGYADLSLRAVDMLKVLVRSVADALSGGTMPEPDGYEALKSFLSDPEAAGISQQSQEVRPSPRTDHVERKCQVGDASQDDVEATAFEATGKKNSPHPGADEISRRLSEQPAGKGESKLDSSVRVSTTRLDRLIDTVGELVIAHSMVAQDHTLFQESCHDLMRKVAHAGKIVRELQDLSMSMRMVPLKATFQKMHRLVRDLSHKSGKKVSLIAEDGDTEIDRHMVDIINDLLVHMVRNAVDHGIEMPDIRSQKGKEPTGTVRLAAFHSGGSVVVEIRDDGRGLDREQILKKAVATGLVDSDKGISDSDVYNLIFAPGFSTAEKLTDISGRGVGMDVVRKGVEALHGRIDIVTEPGRGSTFSVRLPLTLAITDGMLVKVGPDRYIIPTVNIHLSFRPKKDQLSTVAGRGEMVLLRGELMPIFRLHRLFGIGEAIVDPTVGLLVVVGDLERRCALLVDELLGQQQFVAKSLGDGVGKVQGVSGAAILGDGRVGLILDPAEIVTLARQDTPNREGVGRPAA